MFREKTLVSTTFNREKELIAEIGRGLEDSLNEAKKTDSEILKHINFNVMGDRIRNLPIIGKYANRFVFQVKSVRPLKSLEFELRTSLNNTLISIVKIGEKASQEKERIGQLEEIYETAVRENWNSDDFLNFIEANTDINFNPNLNGRTYNLKGYFTEIESFLSPERTKEKQKENFDWLKQHINLSRQYLESMHALFGVAYEWVGGMSRSYFDLTQLIGGMEEIRITLQNLGSGSAATISSQQALRQYGTAYVDGMIKFVQAYKKISALKDNGSVEFNDSIQKLKEELYNPFLLDKSKSENFSSRKYLINPKKD